MQHGGSGCQHDSKRADGSSRGGNGSPSLAGYGSCTSGKSHKRESDSCRTGGYGGNYRNMKFSPHAGLNSSASITRDSNHKELARRSSSSGSGDPKAQIEGTGGHHDVPATKYNKNTSHHTHHMIPPQIMHAKIHMGIH